MDEWVLLLIEGNQRVVIKNQIFHMIQFCCKSKKHFSRLKYCSLLKFSEARNWSFVQFLIRKIKTKFKKIQFEKKFPDLWFQITKYSGSSIWKFWGSRKNFMFWITKVLCSYMWLQILLKFRKLKTKSCRFFAIGEKRRNWRT